MFEYNGKKYTLAQVEAAASKANLSLDEYIKKASLTTIEPGKTTPTTPDAVVEETAASDQPSMELDSVDTSSESPKIEYVRDGKGGFIPKPVQLDIDTSSLPKTSEPATDEQIEAFVKQEKDLKQAIFERKYQEALQEGFSKKTNSKFGKLINQLENDWIIRNSQIFEDAPVIAIGSFARKIFGQEAVEKFANDINLPEGLDFERRIEQTKIKEAKMGQSASFSKSFKEKDLGEFVAALAGGISNIGSIVAQQFLTRGAAIPISFYADSYVDINEAKAKAKGKTIRELADENDLDFYAPLVFGGLMGLLERLKLGTINKRIVNSIGATYAKKTANRVIGGTENAAQEYFQGILSKVQIAVGEDKSMSDITNVLVDSLNDPEVLEGLYAGFFTGATIVSGATVGKEDLIPAATILSAATIANELGPDNIILGGGLTAAQITKVKSLLRSKESRDQIDQILGDISALKESKAESSDQQVIEGYDSLIEEMQNKISKIVKQENIKIDQLSENDLKSVASIKDLSKELQQQLNILSNKFNKEKSISKQEYDVARQSLLNKFKKQKEEIQNTVGDITQKNLNISSENERLISIIKNPESSEIAIQKAKNDIVKNNEGLVNKLINSVYNPQIQSGLTKEDVSGKAYAEVAALINSYKPDSKVPFGAYLKQNLLKRVPSFFEIVETKDGEIIGKVDVTEQTSLADDLDVELGADIATEATTAQQNKVREAIGVTQEQSVGIGKKILRGKLPGVTERIKGKQKGFLSAIRKAAKTALTTDMLNAIGGNFTEKEAQISDYTSMLDILYEDLVNNIPNEYKNVQFKDLFKPVKVGRAKTAVGEDVFEYTMPTKKEFIDFFTNLNHSTITATSEAGKYNQLRARKVRIAEALAEVVGTRGVREALELDENIEKEFKERQDLLDKEIPDAPGARIIEQIDSWIEQWDALKPEPGELRATFGVIELFHGAGKLFLQSVKASVKAGIKFSEAVKKAIKEVQNYLNKQNATELEKEQIVDVLQATQEKDLNTKAPVFYKNAKERLKGNIKKRIFEKYLPSLKKEIKNIFESDISDNEKLFKLNEILLRDLFAIRNTFEKNDGYNLNRNDLIVENLIKPLMPANLRKFVKIQNRSIKIEGGGELQYLNFSLPNDTSARKSIIRSELKKEDNIEDSFKQMAEKHKEYAIKFKNLVLSKLEEFKANNDIEGAQSFLQMQGKNMKTAGKSMFPLRLLVVDKNNKLPKKLIPEHNPPYNDAVQLMLRYVSGDISLAELNTALDSFSIDLLDSELAKIYNKTMNSTMGEGYDFSKDPKNARYGSKEYQDALKENDQRLIDLKEQQVAENTKEEFNSIVNEATGINSEISGSRAEALAKNKNRLKLLPPSADDFAGLLYYLAGKGKKGTADLEFFKKTFLDPFAKAMVKFDASKQETLKQYNRLKKLIRKTPAKLSKQNSTGFTNETSIRIYIWNKLGYTIPDITEQEIKDSAELVEKNKDLKDFANNIINISVLGYAEPDAGWTAGTITTDLLTYVNEKARAEFLTEWQANTDATFTKENINKMKAAFGDNYTEALEDVLYRMKTGRRRPMGGNKLTNNFFNWISDSVGAIMFFNSRSALLQQLSFTNFLNFEDNNPIAAAAAFANQKQFWKDYATLFNSDYLKQRRSGVKTDVNADEIAKKVEQGGNIYRNTIAVLLKKGFLPTQIADSNAIALGGASFYRNRIKRYVKEGFSEKEAEQKAFVDFQEASEETQQSSRPDRISMQQASPLGRVILNFGNVLMQYNRRALKDIKDIIAKRPLPGKTIGESNMTRIPRILYYLAAQNIVFNALQSALFALAFSDEEEEEEKNKYFRIANGTADGILRGLGFGGAAVSVGKNMVLEAIKQYESGRPNYEKVGTKILSISPPVDSKIRKLQAAGRAFTYRQTREKMLTKGLSLENPAFEAVGQAVSGLTNIPADRVIRKMDNLSTAATQDIETWQAISLALGYSKWDVGLIESQAKKPKPKTKGLKTKKLKTKKLK